MFSELDDFSQKISLKPCELKEIDWKLLPKSLFEI